MLYVDVGVLPAQLIGRAVDEPDIRDPVLLGSIRRLHDLLQHRDDALEAEEMMGFVGERVRSHLRDREQHERVRGRDAELAGSLRDLLDEHAFEVMTLADAGRILGASTPRLARAFGRTFGISPHRYVVGRRIEMARKRILDGEPLAQTANAVGFHDQAHFTRHFRRHVGETPGRFASSAAEHAT